MSNLLQRLGQAAIGYLVRKLVFRSCALMSNRVAKLV
jgi:hypothetical protein